MINDKSAEKAESPGNSEFSDEDEPKDKFCLVVITLFVLGIVTALPGLFIANANEYWMYKLRNTALEKDIPSNRTFIQKNFGTFQSFAVIGPLMIMFLFTTFAGHKIKSQTKAFIFLGPITLTFMAHAIVVHLNTDNWQLAFFLFTFVSLIIISVTTGFGALGCLTLVSSFPINYTKCFLVGQGFSGIFTSVIRIISIASSPSTLDSAFIYFVTGTIIMGVATVLYSLTTITPFYKHYANQTKHESKKKINSIPEISQMIVVIWRILLLTLIMPLFPLGSVANLVVSEYKDTGSTWGDRYFVTIATYLTQAVCDIIGKTLATLIDKDFSWWFLYAATFFKTFVLGLFIFFSNASPRKHTDVIFNHDWEYILIMCIFSICGSYLDNVILLKLIRMVPKNKLELAISVHMFFTAIIDAITAPLGLVVVELL
ncbi:equilibrative nucleoside transporter 1-like [Cylas formicarius]|uniref:equilibrative nucleoside transporter 1-like n=1 Tax=Cylas formicarius TaxID=197179 RepID=UPI0029584165|nr:equilibrative nucleoside transporter 1-like [Cylas formicarius]